MHYQINKNTFQKINFFLINLAFFLLFFANNCWAEKNTRVEDFQEQITLTKNGINSRVSMVFRIVNLPKNYYLNSYQISSSAKDSIKFSQVYVDDLPAQYSQENATLKIKFNQTKKDQETFKISYVYELSGKNLNEDFRQEVVYVPSFAVNAKYKVSLDLGTKYEPLEILNQAKRIRNSQGSTLVFEGEVPQDGVVQIVRLTSNNARYQAVVRNIITINNLNGTLEAKTPILFREGWQLVDKQQLTSTLASTERGTDKKNIFFKFKVNENDQKIIIENKALIVTGKKNQVNLSRNPFNYNEFSSEESSLINPLLSKAKTDLKYQDLPLYAQLTMFTHDYLKYDLSYYGKEISLWQIIQDRAGVCSEYAKLLNAMARVAGIPAITVNGLALNDKGKFEAHAWNALYVDNDWIFVDPTWGLNSGIVSSAHLYLRDEGSKDIELKFLGNKEGELSANFEFVVDKIE